MKIIAILFFVISTAEAETYRLRPNFHYLNYGRLRSPYECIFDLKKSVDFAKVPAQEMELENTTLQDFAQIEIRVDGKPRVRFQTSFAAAELLVRRWTNKVRWFSVTEDIDCASQGGAGYSRVRNYELID